MSALLVCFFSREFHGKEDRYCYRHSTQISDDNTSSGLSSVYFFCTSRLCFQHRLFIFKLSSPDTPEHDAVNVRSMSQVFFLRFFVVVVLSGKWRLWRHPTYSCSWRMMVRAGREENALCHARSLLEGKVQNQGGRETANYISYSE